jgi:hypothetical protein
MKRKEQTYSTWGRPFRLQLPVDVAAGFDAPASRGQCQYAECWLFEWEAGRAYCRDHWLEVHGQSRLPERYGQPEERREAYGWG